MAKAHDTTETAMPKGEVADDIHGLTTALKGDLTKLAGPKADKAISHWTGLLEKVGPGTKPITTDLTKLRELVTGGETRRQGDREGARLAVDEDGEGRRGHRRRRRHRAEVARRRAR